MVGPRSCGSVFFILSGSLFLSSCHAVDSGASATTPAAAQSKAATTSAKNLPQFDVRDFGAKGDGKTDDTLAINAAVRKAAETGGVVNFSAGTTYLVRRRPDGGQTASILLRAGVSLDGHGATLLLDDNCAYIGNVPNLEARALVDTDAKIGDTTVHVTTTAPFVAGDVVGLKLGDNEWDKAETKEMIFTTVRRVIDGQRLQLANPLPRAIDVKNTVGRNRGLSRFRAGDNPRYLGGFIQNFRLERTERGSPEAGIDLRCAQGSRIENITASDPGAGVVMLAYCTDVLVRRIRCERSVIIGGHPAKGRVLNVWNCTRCTLEDIEGHAFASAFVFIESYCRDLRCINWRIVNDWRDRFGTTRPARWLLFVAQDSEATFTDLQITGDFDAEVFIDTGGTPGRIVIDGLTVNGTGRFKSLALGQVTARGLTLGDRHFAGAKTHTFSTDLAPGGAPFRSAVLPGELWRRVEVEATGLKQTEKIMVNGLPVTVSPTAPKGSGYLGNLANFGTDYPPNPPADHRLEITAPQLSSKISLKVTVEYFLPAAAASK